MIPTKNDRCRNELLVTNWQVCSDGYTREILVAYQKNQPTKKPNKVYNIVGEIRNACVFWAYLNEKEV